MSISLKSKFSDIIQESEIEIEYCMNIRSFDMPGYYIRKFKKFADNSDNKTTGSYIKAITSVACSNISSFNVTSLCRIISETNISTVELFIEYISEAVNTMLGYPLDLKSKILRYDLENLSEDDRIRFNYFADIFSDSISKIRDLSYDNSVSETERYEMLEILKENLGKYISNYLLLNLFQNNEAEIELFQYILTKVIKVFDDDSRYEQFSRNTSGVDFKSLNTWVKIVYSENFRDNHAYGIFTKLSTEILKASKRPKMIKIINMAKGDIYTFDINPRG